LAGARRLANGSLFYQFEDKELSIVVRDDEKLK
jgi:hypothetical protein